MRCFRDVGRGPHTAEDRKQGASGWRLEASGSTLPTGHETESSCETALPPGTRIAMKSARKEGDLTLLVVHE